MNAVAWQRKTKKEIAQSWKWIRQQNPDAAAEAARWAEENKEDMKDVDRILYRSDESYYGKTASLDPEDAESMDAEAGYQDPEAFLPEDAHERIYGDHAHVQNPYASENSETEVELCLPEDVAAGLYDLTDLQREVIFRNVINGEEVSAIAEEKGCSARNIRDVRTRALKALRAALRKGAPGTGYPDEALFVLWMLLLGFAVYLLLVPNAAEPWMRTAVFVLLPVVTVAAVGVLIGKLRRSNSRIRKYLASLKKKK
ncbi:hypothetical protein OBV_30690 [Oscillibacter valericigenes Sjm18-20]|nr:hypothetical protein OBV_30690 [Oscillibacter valericigenes Sjm18-20]